MSDEAVLSVNDLSITLPGSGDRTYAVQNINLQVHANEIVCIVGESGSGKSVTAFSVIRLLAKALQVASGSIVMGGRDLLGLSEAQMQHLRGNEIAMVFQEPMTALNPSFTIGDQIAEMYVRHRPQMPRKERKLKVLELLQVVKMPTPETTMNAYPRQLSGGQRQRVMIAMAMALSPRLLIADEPTTALDVTTQARILEMIDELRRRIDTGILFITHDFGVVASIADRVLVMEQGVLVEEGETEQIIYNPQHPYTQKLIAAIPGLNKAPDAARKSRAEHPVLLDARQLTKTYRTRHGVFGKVREVAALKAVDFRMRAGESVAIVGESGSGKSTLAACIMRLTKASSGSIQIGGEDFFALKGHALKKCRRKIQIVFQDPYSSLNPRKTIRDILLQGSLNYGIPKAQALERAKSLLEIVQMDTSTLVRYPNQFSGGQRQRICIARALMLEPNILIADEAVSALDVSIQAEVLDLFRDIRTKMNLSLIFVTHDLRVASQICERVLVMKHGEVVEQGLISDVFSNPQNDYTQSLLDAVPGKNAFERMALSH